MPRRNNKSNKTSKINRRTSACLFEAMEQRRMMSANLSNGTLTITGTGGNDTIILTRSNDTVTLEFKQSIGERDPLGASPAGVFRAHSLLGYPKPQRPKQGRRAMLEAELLDEPSSADATKDAKSPLLSCATSRLRPS